MFCTPQHRVYFFSINEHMVDFLPPKEMLTYGYNKFNIIGMDPGMSNTGVSVFGLLVNDSGYQIDSIYSETFHPSSGYERYDHYENNSSKFNELLDYVTRIINFYEPKVIITEDSFFHEQKPGAFRSVTTAISVIKSAISLSNRNIHFHTLAPRNVKKCLGVDGEKGKLVIKEAILKSPDLNFLLPHNFEHLDEHAIDSIAVGYSYLKQIRENPES